ncbi:MAG TPA: hypothetical protein VGR21_08090 [Cryptosporangiaceae bacterium]|nr:hypothetical protein [Cryptosporangiaceae bacterium]
MRWWTVLVGFGTAMVYYVLVTVLALSGGTVTAFVVWLLVGLAVASGASVVLLAQGDRGAGIGAMMMSGVALSVIVLVLGIAVIRDGGLLG